MKERAVERDRGLVLKWSLAAPSAATPLPKREYSGLLCEGSPMAADAGADTEAVPARKIAPDDDDTGADVEVRSAAGSFSSASSSPRTI
jgi:hypothetical protein